MAKDWIMVRISPDTHAELQRVRESMRVAQEMGLVELDTDDRDRVSLDQVIRRLLDMRQKHAERRARSAAARSRRKAAAAEKADTGEEVGGNPPHPPTVPLLCPAPES